MNCCLAPDCLMGGLGGDNMTVVLICFLHNKPYEHLVERCASSLSAPDHTFMSLRNRNLVADREPLLDENEESGGDGSNVKATATAEKEEKVTLRRVVNNDDDDNEGDLI